MKDFLSKCQDYWAKYQEKKMSDLDARELKLKKELAVTRLETQIKKEKLKSSEFTRRKRQNNIDRVASLFKGNVKPIKFNTSRKKKDKDIFSSDGFY